MSVAPFTKVGSQLLVDGAMYTETGGVVLADTGAPCAVTVGPVVAPFDEAEYFATQVRAVLRKFGTDAHVWMPGPGVPVLGLELISNGDFSNGTTGWNWGAGWSIAGGAATGSATAASVFQFVGEAGKTYQVTCQVTNYVSGTLRAVAGSGNYSSTTISSAGSFSALITCAGTGSGNAVGVNASVAFTGAIDNISVKEVLSYSTLLNGFQAANYLEANASGAPQVVDQPVGYVGDAANVTLGPELVTNGDFSNGTTGWFATDATASVVDGQLSINASLTTGRAEQSLTVTANKVYKLSARMSAGTATSVRIEAIRGPAGSYGLLGASENVTTVGKDLSLVFFATGSDVILKARTNGVTGTFTIDNVSLKEITGAIPATQNATSNKPFLRRGHVNRMARSADFGVSPWVRVDATLTNDGTLSPFGEAGSWRVAQSTVNSVVRQDSIAVINGVQYVTSVYVKKSALSWLCIANATTGTVYGWFDFTGPVPTSPTAGTTITDAGNGWYRVSKTFTAASAAASISFLAVTANNTVNRDTSAVYYLYGAQLETGSTVNPYVPTAAAAASSNTGGYWWEFDGTNDVLIGQTPPWGRDDDMAVVAAYRPTEAAATRTVFSVTADTVTSARWPTIYNSSPGNINVLWRDDAGAGTAATVSAPANGSAYVVGVKKVGANGSLRLNGGAWNNATLPAGASAFNRTAIGATATNAVGWLGSIYATITIKGTVSDADLRILEKFVGQQAGVTIT